MSNTNKDKLEAHAYCAFFPKMPGDEFKGLKESIKSNGLLNPIVTYQGEILDGAHRYRACWKRPKELKRRTESSKSSGMLEWSFLPIKLEAAGQAISHLHQTLVDTAEYLETL